MADGGLNPEDERSEVLAVQIRPGQFCREQLVSGKCVGWIWNQTTNDASDVDVVQIRPGPR